MNNAQTEDVPRKQPTSVRKVEANRRNASKSTGPKTTRGKANSRKNAITHGLFIRQMDNFLDEGDEQDAFTTSLKRLWDELQPVGPREENEVAYIAISWLRLDRLWRFENAEADSARHEIDQNIERGFYSPLYQVRERTQIATLLRSAKEEAESHGKVSPATLGKIFEEDSLEGFWSMYEDDAVTLARRSIKEIARTIADERKIPLGEAKRLLAENPESTAEFGRFVALETVKKITELVWRPWREQSKDIKRTARQLETIPDGAVEKVIRYGNAIERQLSRAYARLDRLQSRRRGEGVPSQLVDVYLTR